MNYYYHGGIVVKSYLFGDEIFYDLGFSLNEDHLKASKEDRYMLEGDYKKKPENFFLLACFQLL